MLVLVQVEALMQAWPKAMEDMLQQVSHDLKCYLVSILNRADLWAGVFG